MKLYASLARLVGSPAFGSAALEQNTRDTPTKDGIVVPGDEVGQSPLAPGQAGTSVTSSHLRALRTDIELGIRRLTRE